MYFEEFLAMLMIPLVFFGKWQWIHQFLEEAEQKRKIEYLACHYEQLMLEFQQFHIIYISYMRIFTMWVVSLCFLVFTWCVPRTCGAEPEVLIC